MNSNLSKSSEKLSLSIAFDLYSAIKTGKYPVGAWLPTESRLSIKYGVSRNTIREAVAFLRDADLISTLRGSGTKVVSNLGNFNTGIFLQDFLAKKQLLIDLYDYRRVLEVEIVGKASLRRSEEDLKTMSDNLDLLKNCVASRTNIVSVGFEFHKIIAEAAKSDIGLGMFTNLRGILTQVMGRLALLQGVDAITLDLHSEIFEAIKANDEVRAKKCMEKDMESAMRQLLWVLDRDPQFIDFLVG